MAKPGKASSEASFVGDIRDMPLIHIPIETLGELPLVVRFERPCLGTQFCLVVEPPL